MLNLLTSLWDKIAPDLLTKIVVTILAAPTVWLLMCLIRKLWQQISPWVLPPFSLTGIWIGPLQDARL